MAPPRAVQLNEANAFLKEHPEVQYVDLLITDMNGVVRGKRIERASLHKVYEKGINLPASLFALDINGITVESTGLGMDIGDSDRICFPIPNTLSKEPWQKRPTAQLLMTMHERDGAPFFADPREVLRQVVSKFDELGLTICAAFELEFYLIDQENINGRPQPPRSPISGKRPHSTGLSDRRPGRVRRLPAGHSRRRQGTGHPGRCHRQGKRPGAVRGQPPPRRRSDQGMRLRGAAEAADQEHRLRPRDGHDLHGQALPGQAGNGLHVHISLLDKNGNNIFATDNPLDSQPLRHAIGGLQQTMAASMAFLCPNVNSYRRFGAQFYVPNAPCWGMDNRTVALRVPTDSPDAVRIEHRVAGADANPTCCSPAFSPGCTTA